MSMSTHVDGIREPDERWQRMKAVWDSCVAANIEPPDEVHEFFNHMKPDGTGIIVSLDSTYGGGVKIAREWNDGDHQAGLEIDIADLPPNITKIRFYNSW